MIVACNASRLVPPPGCARLEKLPPSNTEMKGVAANWVAAETEELAGVAQSTSIVQTLM